MLERTAEASGASGSSSSSSPSSILRERFLVRAGRRAEGELTDPSTIRALIAGLRSTASASAERSGSLSSSSSDVLSPRSRAEKERQELLKHYIEKLLGMKREDIAELSVSSSANTTASSEATRYV